MTNAAFPSNGGFYKLREQDKRLRHTQFARQQGQEFCSRKEQPASFHFDRGVSTWAPFIRLMISDSLVQLCRVTGNARALSTNSHE